MIVGVFVVVGMTALIWLIFKFGDLPGIVTKFDSFEVFVQFPTAPGVQNDTPVRFCGYQIGRVTKVMAPAIKKHMETGLDFYQTVVVLSIDKSYENIPSNVEVKLMTRGLGSSYIELAQSPGKPAVPLDPNRPETQYLIPEIWLQGSTGMTSEFFPEESQKKLSELIDGLKTFITSANDIIGDKDNQGNIKEILANMTEVTEQAKHTIEEFRNFAAAGTSTLKNADAQVDDIVTALVDTSKEFREFVAAGTSTLQSVDTKAEKLVTAMVDTSEELSKATSQLRLVLEKVNSGQGSAARLLNDGRFYENLIENTEQLQAMLKSLQSLIEQVKEKGLRSIY